MIQQVRRRLFSVSVSLPAVNVVESASQRSIPRQSIRGRLRRGSAPIPPHDSDRRRTERPSAANPVTRAAVRLSPRLGVAFCSCRVQSAAVDRRPSRIGSETALGPARARSAQRTGQRPRCLSPLNSPRPLSSIALLPKPDESMCGACFVRSKRSVGRHARTATKKRCGGSTSSRGNSTRRSDQPAR